MSASSFDHWGSGRITDAWRIRCNVCRWKKTIQLLPSQTSIKSSCKWFVLHPSSESSEFHSRTWHSLNLSVLNLLKSHTSLTGKWHWHNPSQTTAQPIPVHTAALVVGPVATALGSPIPSSLRAGVPCSI